MDKHQIITLTISILAFCLGVFNFIINYRSKVRNRVLQKRDDRIESDELLDKAYDCIYGVNGYNRTKDMEKFHEAESAVLRAKELDPKYSRTVEYEGRILDVMGKDDMAMEKYKAALQLKPLRWATYNMMGLMHSGDEAITYFKKALEVNDKVGLPYFNIGRMLKGKGEYEEAKQQFLKSLKFMPRYPYTHFELAELYKKEEKYKLARQRFERAISINPKYTHAMVSLGAMIAVQDDWEDGISWVEQAMKINPADSHPVAMMAALHADRNDYENALKFCDKAIEMDTTRKMSDDVMQELKREMIKLRGKRE